jgi:hypothetical protein
MSGKSATKMVNVVLSFLHPHILRIAEPTSFREEDFITESNLCRVPGAVATSSCELASLGALEGMHNVRSTAITQRPKVVAKGSSGTRIVSADRPVPQTYPRKYIASSQYKTVDLVMETSVNLNFREQDTLTCVCCQPHPEPLYSLLQLTRTIRLQ